MAKNKINMGIISEFKKMDRKFYKKDTFLGKCIVTMANGINSSRSLMVSSQLDQTETLQKPEVPKVYTDYEDLIGDHSTGYLKTDCSYKVLEKIVKFEDNPDSIYILILEDDDGNLHAIQKVGYEILSESHGFNYITECIDSYEVGDIIYPDTVLYHSTSYDEKMNYRYGLNALAMYTTDTDTTEDAIKISDVFERRTMSSRYHTVRIPQNDNDILRNLYGKGDEYKAFPDIGEKIKKHIVAAQHRIDYSQILFDLKTDNLSSINYQNDTVYYSKGTVVDINIYCNKPVSDIKNKYNEQVIRYYSNELRYHKEIASKLYKYKKDSTSIIINEDGEEQEIDKCSNDFNYILFKSSQVLDPNTRWKDDNGSVFSNMIIELIIIEDHGANAGSKFTGRYGNKGVVSKVVPQSEMPYIYRDGKKVYMDIILNEFGKYNRLNPKQQDEVEINFIKNRFIEIYVSQCNSDDEKLDLILEFLNDVNPSQCDRVKEYLKSIEHLDTYKQDIRELVEDIENGGMCIQQNPFWDNLCLSDFERIYKKWDRIDKHTVYLNRFGREIELLNKHIVGEQYIMKLMHTAEGKFSARSTAQLNTKDLPDRSMMSKNHKSLYAKTPTKNGEMELLNMMISNDMDFIKHLYMTLSTSVQARRNTKVLFNNNPLDYDKIPIDDSCINRSAEILNIKLFSLGVGLKYVDDITGEEYDIFNTMKTSEESDDLV